MGHSFKREPSFSLVVPCCRRHLAPPEKSSFAADSPPFRRVFSSAKSKANWGEGKKFAQLQKYGEEESLFLFLFQQRDSVQPLAPRRCLMLLFELMRRKLCCHGGSGWEEREGRVPPQNESLNCRSRAIKLHVELGSEAAARSSQI